MLMKPSGRVRCRESCGPDCCVLQATGIILDFKYDRKGVNVGIRGHHENPCGLGIE